MVSGSFDRLSTEKFRKVLKPHADKIYGKLFPGCKVEDLRGSGNKVHVLDKEFGIDTKIIFPSGQWVTMQEKFRQYEFYTKYRIDKRCPDFTQEFKNGVGTQYEGPGEWFQLAAQLYFYGWGKEAVDGFHSWVLLDVALYKLIVQQNGGLDRIGRIRNNSKHGAASFYCIPICKLHQACIAHAGKPYIDTAILDRLRVA